MTKDAHVTRVTSVTTEDSVAPTLARRSRALLIAGAAAIGAFVIASAMPADAYPSEDEVEAARAAVASANASVAELDGAIAELEQLREEAHANEAMTYEAYLAAAERADATAAAAVAADEAARLADIELAEARDTAAAFALATYRGAGSLEQLTALLSDDGVERTIEQDNYEHAAVTTATAAMTRLEEAETLAAAAHATAESSAAAAAEAALAAQATLAIAQDATIAANQAYAAMDEVRAEAVARAAELNGITVALEEERQAGLAAERAAANAPTGVPVGNTVGGGSDGGSSAGDSSGSSSGGSSSGSGGSGTGGSAPDPNPTESNEPEPEPTTTQTSEPEPEPTTTQTSEPAPVQTTPPPSTGGSSGGWSTTSSQGVAASNYAQANLLGKPYLLGGNGPTYYDCSSFTKEAWQAAGYTLSRTAQGQYNQVTKIPISQARPGDLIFWGSGGSTSAIYHVEIYIGGGLTAGAKRPGVNSSIVAIYPYRTTNLIPYAGRP